MTAQCRNYDAYTELVAPSRPHISKRSSASNSAMARTADYADRATRRADPFRLQSALRR